MQLTAASPFLPAPTYQPSRAFAAPGSEPVESVDLSEVEPSGPSSQRLAGEGRRTAAEAAAPLLGLFARATGGNCPYLAATPRASGLELMGSVVRHLDNPRQVLGELHQRHGSHFQVKLPGKPVLLFDSRPEVMHQALAGTRNKKGQGVWEKTPELAHGFRHLFGSENVFSGTGQAWRTSRELLEPVMRGSHVHTQANIEHLAEVFDRHLDSVGEGELDLRHLTQRATLDAAFQMLFGARLSDAELDGTLEDFGVVRRTLAAETLNPTDLSLARLGASSLAGAHQRLRSLADRLIDERRDSGQERPDALGALLAANPPLSPERLRNEVLTLMLAGHETTASLLSWALLELAHNRPIQQQLQGALVDGLPRPGQSGEVKAVLLETMRLHSPAYLLARVAEEDTYLGQTFVPRGTTLVMSPLESHQDRQAWGEDVEQFRPERFRGSAAKMFGFGGGTRLCLGQNLARLESTVFLTRFLQRFELEPISGFQSASDVSHYPREAKVNVRLRSKPT